MPGYFDISVKLPITQGDIVYVPGGEPLSEVTSGTLIAIYPYLYKRPYVRLCEILERIPVAKVQYLRIGGGINSGRPTRFVVFPDDSTDDRPRTDWFAKLREIANSEDECVKPSRDQKEYCNSISNKSDDFISPHYNKECKDTDTDSPYLDEGLIPNTGLVLPPLVGWQIPKKDFE